MYVFTEFIYLFIYHKHNGMPNLKTAGNTHVSTEKTECYPTFK